MASEEELAELIAKTQSDLGAIIKRPRLTDALLKKPPFRFLHDIVSEVNKATGFAEGLYDDDEKNAQNIKDKESKLAFLTKIIDCVGIAQGSAVVVKPTKIVAGLEPENTNGLLQCLAAVASDPSVDRAGAVNAVLSGQKPGGAAPAKPKKSAPPPAADPPAAEPAAEEPPRRKKKAPVEDAPPAAPAADDDPYAEKPAPSEKRERRRRKEEGEAERERPGGEGGMYGDERPLSRDRARRGRREHQEAGGLGETQPPAASAEDEPYGGAGGTFANEGAFGDGGMGGGVFAGETAAPELDPYAGEGTGGLGLDNEAPKKARPERPTTARRAPPRLPSNVKPVEKKDLPIEDTKIASVEGGPGAASAGVIIEGSANDDDDDVAIVVDGEEKVAQAKKVEEADPEQHGKLVRDILDTKKQVQEEDADADRQGARGDGKPQKKGVVLKRKMKKDGDNKQTTRNEIQKLRESIQTLTQTTNPLGRCMDYVQEDMENMAKELEKWHSEVQKQAMNLEEEQKQSEYLLQDSQGRIGQVDEEIEEVLWKINSIKANVLRNDVKIENLLRMVVSNR